MKRLILLFFFFTLATQAQLIIKGIVKDDASGNVLPFASISAAAQNNTVADVDGKFTLNTRKQTTAFHVSYIGYNTAVISVNSHKKFYTVRLTPQPNPLREVVISSQEDAALAIIRKVVLNRNLNDPEKKLSSFQFKAYNDIIVTAEPDSIVGRVDSVFTGKKSRRKFTKLDSSDYNFKKLISKQHLFQTEKISEYQYNKKSFKENILGTKMAGFKEPVYEILGLKLQSFSIYDDRYELFETKYKSPISEQSMSDYNFKMLDSVKMQGRDLYVIYFKDRHKKHGLAGLLYIDQTNFSVAKAVMRAKGVLDISGIHEYKYIPTEDLWFPSRAVLKIVKGKSKEDIHLLGETLQFDNDLPGKSKSRDRVASDNASLKSETRIFDLEYNIPLEIKYDFIAIHVEDEAINRSEDFWSKYRKDTLDFRRPTTYVAVDSIAQKNKIEKRLLLLRKILSGYVPFGVVDMDARYLFSYNNYEGFRLGLGGRTNERFSKKYRIEGYTKYGTKDGEFKYSLGASTRLDRYTTTWIGGSYTDDVKEIASTTFAIDKRVFKLYDPRPINVSTVYNYKTWRAYIETKIIPKTESIWQISNSRIEPKFNYIFNLDGKMFSVYSLTTAMVSLQWNPFSDYMQTPEGRVEVEKHFPKFTFQFSQTVPKFVYNDFEFSKFDFRTEYEKKYLSGQKTAALFEAGYAFGDVPITHLYNTSPNNLSKERVIQRITLAGKNSFETMYFNEFFSSEYVYLQLKHGFQRVTLLKKVRPALVIVTRMAWGNLQKPEQHLGIEYKTLNKGYFESGIELNQIYSALGLSCFYRYGPNQLARFEDNLAVKLTFVINLGF